MIASALSNVSGVSILAESIPCNSVEQRGRLAPNDHDCRPRYIHFQNVQLLSSRPSLFTKNQSEINRITEECTFQATDNAPLISIIIPVSPEEQVRFVDTNTGQITTRFYLSNVACCAKGTTPQKNRSVLITHRDQSTGGSLPSFESAHKGEESTSTVDQTVVDALETSQGRHLCRTHVVRCSTVYEASRLVHFMADFLNRKPGRVPDPFSPEHGVVGLRLIVDLREEDKGMDNEWKAVPKEKGDIFKLRAKTDKRLFIGFSQSSGLAQLSVERLLDISMAYGRYLTDSELTQLEMDENHLQGDAAAGLLAGSLFCSSAHWPVGHKDFVRFDEPTSKDECVFFTISVCFKLLNIEEPIRLHYVCRGRIFKPDEVFWLMTDRKPATQDYPVQLTEYVDSERNLLIGQFIKAELIPCYRYPSLTLKTTPPIQNLRQNATDDDDEDSENEPLMSGHGSVSQEVTDDQLLKDWGLLIPDWQARVRQVCSSTPYYSSTETEKDRYHRLLVGTIGPGLSCLGQPLSQRIKRLVSRGIPDALRAEIWPQLAACASTETSLMDAYRILITKPCKYDAVIRRDLSRTFPAHRFFRQSEGQEYLFQVSRAYALYDEEVGYCQGLSFFAAVLLLHMPVEQAFTLMVQVNNQYGVRELILNDFEGLHLRLYQLQRIIQDQLPDLAKHFTELGLETHMYANQWFLTLFTAKFPLPMVFHIVDLFLTEGMIFIFKVAFCLLRLARRDLLGLDFEGVLKYLRITMPKRFMDTESGSELLSAAVTAKITSSRMLKYAKEWEALKSRGKPPESAVQLLERQVATLRREVSRLERENESLASGLMSSKTSMHQRVDKLEDKAEVLTRELFASRQDLHDTLEEKAHLESEVIQIKQMLRSTLDQTADERVRYQSLIATYRAIATDLVKRHQLSTAGRENGGSHTVKGDASQDSSTSTTSLTPDSDALYLRLLWVLVQQTSQCATCAPVLETMVSNWRCAESTDVNGVGDADVEIGTESIPVEPTLEEPVKSSTSQSDCLHDGVPPPESYTPSSLRHLKPKQWLSEALTTLRSMANMDNPTGGSGNTWPRLSSVRTPAPTLDTRSHPNGC